MKRLASVPILLCLCLASAQCADPPVPVAPVVRLPDPGVVPPPPPPPPGGPAKLPSDSLYVIDADVDCVVLLSPDGLVTVTQEAGPVKIKAKFVGGTGKFECRTFKGKNIWTLEAAGTGRVELLVIPAGGTVIRRLLDVDNGTVPIPPGPTDPFAAALQAAYTADPDPAKTANVKLLAQTYRTGATLTSDITKVTLGNLFTAMMAADKTPQGAVASVRKVVGQRLNASLGTDPNAPLNRILCASELNTVSAALEGLK